MLSHTPTPRRAAGLDMLRIALALLIYMFHSNIHLGCTYSCLTGFVSAGALAMTGFFMLSGYSLRLAYGDRDLMEGDNLKRFYLRRMLGVLPMYYIFALTYILLLGNESMLDNLILFPIEALCLQSTFSSLFGVTHNGGTWFMSCLVLGYFMYPFLQTIVRRLSVRRKVLLLIVLMAVELCAVVVRHHFHTAKLYDNPFYRILEMAMGLIIADINVADGGFRIKRKGVALLATLLAMVAAVSVAQRATGTHDYMLYNWIVLPCFAVLLSILGCLRLPRCEKSKLLEYASRVTFPFFLIQFWAWPVGRWFIKTTGCESNILTVLFTFSFCVAGAVLAYELVQKRLVAAIRKKCMI